MRIVRILGVDPGSRLTGYGCVDLIGKQLRLVTHGTLKLSNTSGRAEIPLEHRLLLIHEGLSKVIEEFKPHVMSIERVFFAKNAVSALKLGQARGAAILSGAIHSLDIVEYSPSEVKAAVVGHGQASKDQVARMIELLVGRQEFTTPDASDGLALAICHAHMVASLGSRPDAFAKSFSSVAGRGKKRRMSLAEAVGIHPNSVEARGGKRPPRPGKS